MESSKLAVKQQSDVIILRIDIIRNLLEYYGKPTNPFPVNIWLEATMPLSLEEIRDAIAQCFRKYHFLPTINEFLALTGISQPGEKAWEKITGILAIATSDLPEEVERRREVLKGLTETEHEALSKAGGLQNLSFASLKDLAWYKEQFLSFCTNVQNRQS